MNFATLFIIGVGLSMDAFAVSISKGLCLENATKKTAGIFGLYFGGFQALMPVIGFLAGFRFQDSIKAYDHWIAFIILGLIGFNMIKESFEKESEISCETEAESTSPKKMLPLAIATSIDALAVGVSFAFLNVNIISSSVIIGVITFCFSYTGVKLGQKFGNRWKSKSELIGGFILAFIGLKILVEHLFFS